jgi:hypothetical protein
MAAEVKAVGRTVTYDVGSVHTGTVLFAVCRFVVVAASTPLFISW